MVNCVIKIPGSLIYAPVIKYPGLFIQHIKRRIKMTGSLNTVKIFCKIRDPGILNARVFEFVPLSESLQFLIVVQQVRIKIDD